MSDECKCDDNPPAGEPTTMIDPSPGSNVTPLPSPPTMSAADVRRRARREALWLALLVAVLVWLMWRR